MEAHARLAMAKGALDRLADPDFPHELRLQVMKEGVSECTTWLYIAHGTNLDDMRNAVYDFLVFPFWDYSRAKYAAVREAAEQAFLESVIFKVELSHSITLNSAIGNAALSPLLATIGARLHYLDLSTYIDGSRISHQDILEGTSCRPITRCMDSLKRHFPNLKTCVLTLDLRSNALYYHSSSSPPAHFDQWPSHNRIPRDPSDQSYLTAEVAELFEAFATRGLGKLQFIRIRCTRDKVIWIRAQGASRGRHETVYEPSYCGPLVKVDRAYVTEVRSRDGSLGRELLERVYRLVPVPPTPEPVEQKKYNSFIL
jgi:hypothetical protein